MKKITLNYYLLIYFFAGVATVFVLLAYLFFAPTGVTSQIKISKGSSLSTISKTLSDNRVIRSSNIFILYAKFYGLSEKISYGKFDFDKDDNFFDVVRILSTKKQVSFKKLTIPEGFTLIEIDARLEKMGKDGFLELCYDPQIIKELLGKEFSSMEGFIYPDTYYIDNNSSVEQLLEIFVKEFKNRTAKYDLINNYDKLIMASIIEKEAANDIEKPLVASVFYNRIKRKMRLESCATLEYVLHRKGRLTYDDLEKETPYNTYKHRGFPPTPIGNPGIKSIEAAFDYPKTKYLYFSLQKDGTHHFSKSYKEHLRYK